MGYKNYKNFFVVIFIFIEILSFLIFFLLMLVFLGGVIILIIYINTLIINEKIFIKNIFSKINSSNFFPIMVYENINIFLITFLILYLYFHIPLLEKSLNY